MCGICGIASKNKITTKDKFLTQEMNNKLINRGPDSEGKFSDKNISLAMRRLKIIDINGGDQPLFNEDNSIVLLVNGEIYNYKELKKELKCLGHEFRTESDSEVIIHSYEEYGEKFLSKLRGMFAFSLYDIKKNILIIARDRLGEKPLYIYKKNDKLFFSSEMKSILMAVPKNKIKIDNSSINLFFHYQFVPEPKTMIEGIEKLPAGTYAVIDLNDFTTTFKTYWDYSRIKKLDSNPQKKIRQEIMNISEIIIRADVPIGISLSGGIDSSLIASLSTMYSNKITKAFSIGYPECQASDESLQAKDYAESLKLPFDRIEITSKNLINDFSKMVYEMDDPIADIAAFGYYSIFKEAKKMNTPVLLNGLGGDELFNGYEWIIKTIKLNKLKNSLLGRIKLFPILLNIYKKDILKKPSEFLKVSKHITNKKYIFYELSFDFRKVSRDFDKIFTKKFKRKICKKTPYEIYSNENIKNPCMTSNKILNKTWLQSNCLALGDRLSMSKSIELRLPFLDYELIETVLGLRKKLRNDYLYGHKYWLISSISGLIPNNILKRKKQGFTPPINDWIEKLLANNKDNILNGYLIKNGIINKKYINKKLKNINKNSNFLYKIIIFENWVKQYIPS